MLRAYIEGTSQFIHNKSTLSFAITDCKGNLEYQFYELLDGKRNKAEIEMLAFTKMIDWLLENKINEIIVYLNSKHVYTNWKSNKTYSLNKGKFERFLVRLIDSSNTSNVVNLAFA